MLVFQRKLSQHSHQNIGNEEYSMRGDAFGLPASPRATSARSTIPDSKAIDSRQKTEYISCII